MAGREVAFLLSLDMLPCLSSDDETDHRLANAEADGQRFQGISNPTNFANIVDSQLGCIYVLPANGGAMPTAIKHVS